MFILYQYVFPICHVSSKQTVRNALRYVTLKPRLPNLIEKSIHVHLWGLFWDFPYRSSTLILLYDLCTLVLKNPIIKRDEEKNKNIIMLIFINYIHKCKSIHPDSGPVQVWMDGIQLSDYVWNMECQVNRILCQKFWNCERIINTF